jgi:hypothetical protein
MVRSPMEQEGGGWGGARRCPHRLLRGSGGMILASGALGVGSRARGREEEEEENKEQEEAMEQAMEEEEEDEEMGCRM